MSYSIVTMGGNLLPAVWPVSATTQDEALKEAHEMRVSQLHLHPALLIDWDEKVAFRIGVSSDPDIEPKIFDNAGKLFGIATTAEHFEQIEEVAQMSLLEDEPCQ